MSRRFINQLTENEKLNQVFQCSDKQVRVNRAGNPYLQLRLSDRTGWLTAMMWNANDNLINGFENGDFIEVQGTTQFYNGNMQLMATKVRKADASIVDESDYVTLASTEIDKMASELAELLREIKSVPLQNLAECFLMDEELMTQFSSAPAGVKNHHAYRGGLMEHAVNLMKVCKAIVPFYPDIDEDLLVFGAFLHDLGKIEELSYERELGYTDVGQLIGHLIIGVEILERKIQESEKLSSEPFPLEMKLRLKHMIVSHHGPAEYGSPKLPMTLEAIALHYLDNLDAKMHSVGQLLSEDTSSDQSWTSYQPALDRKLFKGSGS